MKYIHHLYISHLNTQRNEKENKQNGHLGYFQCIGILGSIN